MLHNNLHSFIVVNILSGAKIYPSILYKHTHLSLVHLNHNKNINPMDQQIIFWTRGGCVLICAALIMSDKAT